MQSDDTSRQFEKLVLAKLNTGHLMIEAGFAAIAKQKLESTINLWDENIGKIGCSCENSNQKYQVLLASSIISHTPAIINSSDFHEVDSRLMHITKFHKVSAVIGLGINSFKGAKTFFSDLSNAQKDFLIYLKGNNVKIGCRGKLTHEFLVSCGFEKQNLFITGCPSAQLINVVQKEIPKNFKRFLISGALINRLDLIKPMSSEQTHILCIPQTREEYVNATSISNLDGSVEIFLPNSLEDWMSKVISWEPEVALGTRLHGNMLALSAGIPTAFMSGDIRTLEIVKTLSLPFFDDIVEVKRAIKSLKQISPESTIKNKTQLGEQILNCIEP